MIDKIKLKTGSFECKFNNLGLSDKKTSHIPGKPFKKKLKGLEALFIPRQKFKKRSCHRAEPQGCPMSTVYTEI